MTKPNPFGGWFFIAGILVRWEVRGGEKVLVKFPTKESEADNGE